MFIDFLFELRRRKVPVGLQEWMTLMRALSLGLHRSSLTGFYHLARSILVHSEAHFDGFDQGFAAHFHGVETDRLDLTKEILEWLSDPKWLNHLSPEMLAALKKLGLDELRKLFEERLREQTERHDGGNRWIGTGGTSPFGHSGYHPSGIRVGGEGLNRSAVQIAGERRYREYRNDLILDVRQMKVALRRMRELAREGSREEIDLEETIDETSRNAGDLTLVFRPPRRNSVRVILLMDVGGSMDPHAALVGRLFTAAHSASHFKDFQHFYFHNCVYDNVYRDAYMLDAIPLGQLLASYGRHYKLVWVGDAMMHPYELVEPGGAILYRQRNDHAGIESMQRLADHFERAAWLNPEPPHTWRHPTVATLGRLFPMFPLTIDGLDDAIATLVKAKPGVGLRRASESAA